MVSPSLPLDQTALCAIGAASAAIGVVGLLAGGRWTSGRAAWFFPLLLSALGTLAGAGTFVAGLPEWVWQPSLVLAAVWLFFAIARSPVLPTAARAVLAVLPHPKAQAASLLLGGGLLLGWQVHQIDANLNQDFALPEAALTAINPAIDLVPFTGHNALTDAGAAIPLFQTRPGLQGPKSSQAEMDSLCREGLTLKLIQTSPATLKYNCHGWIFTAGRCWVRGSTVEQILKDNHYEMVSRPAVGDLAIFRNDQGEVMHSALVYHSREDGAILLESKWGELGQYIHTPADHIYTRHKLAYYHSPRSGHMLRGLGEKRPAPAIKRKAQAWTGLPARTP